MNEAERLIFEGLNPAQEEAVRYIDGPALIVAGAGSGKTRVLTCRIANILAQGNNPGQVLALTFTKKAAGEMKQRVAALVGERNARWIWMGTFHSIFTRFLREYADSLGFPHDFTIYDQSDSRSAVRQCIKELELDDKIYKPNLVQSRISLAKNNLITVAAYRADAELTTSDAAARRGRIVDIYELYTKKCRTAGAMDFDDLLLYTNILFRDNKEALEAIAGRFRFILVDEYQDTNFAQYTILKRLAACHRNICVVGDDSQSIYGFRGARVENILRFKKEYPGTREIRLEQNYRSTQTIVNAANSVIANNENRIKKKCFSKSDAGEKIGVLKAFTEQEEAYLIASSIIERIFRDKASYDKFAILYRTNAQSRSLEEALRKKNLPYRIYAGHSFYDRAEIKDMLAYFRLTVNIKDEEAFRRIINVPARGIGDTSLERISEVAKKAGCSPMEAIMLPVKRLYEEGLKDAAIRRLRAFAVMIMPLHQKAATTNAYELAIEVGNASGMLAAAKNDNTPEGMAMFENLEELFNSVQNYIDEESEMRSVEGIYNEDGTSSTDSSVITLSEYLENISLLTEVEKEDEENKEESNNKISLMTVHSSKGLEFPYVYIAGMEENLFPSENSNGSLAEIEEERRLFYVALTRAKTCATVSFAKNRMRWGKTETNDVSRFVREIDEKYLASPVDRPRPSSCYSENDFRSERNNGNYFKKSTQQEIQIQPQQHQRYVQSARHTPSQDFKPDPVSSLRPGQKVEHDRFGFGTIISFDGSGADTRATVEFEEAGRKTLLLKFAKLRIV